MPGQRVTVGGSRGQNLGSQGEQDGEPELEQKCVRDWPREKPGFLGSLGSIFNTRKFIIKMNMVMRQKGSGGRKEKLAGSLIIFSILGGKKGYKFGTV